MHHLLVTVGSHGDTHPFVGIGQRLRERGHRVSLAANELFRPIVESAGLEFLELGTEAEFNRALANPDIWHPLKGFRAVFEEGVLPLMPRAYEMIADLYVPGETVVTAHAIAFGARVAQERLGVPTATVHLAPAVFRDAHDPPVYSANGWMRRAPAWLNRFLFRAVDRFVADPILAPPLNDFRASVGLTKPVSRVIHDWWNSPDLVLGLFPDWYAPKLPEWPRQLRLTGFPLFDERGSHVLPAEVEAFLCDGAPPVAFTFGSAMKHAREELAASAATCAAIGRRGMLLTRHRDQVPAALPPGVMHVSYAPFSELLPRCAALVHHGGIGTTSQGLAAGVPQLIVPFAHDQHDNARRVMRLGCGLEVRPKAFRHNKGAAALRELLAGQSFATACRDIAHRFSNVDSVAEACDAIETIPACNAPAGR